MAVCCTLLNDVFLIHHNLLLYLSNHLDSNKARCAGEVPAARAPLLFFVSFRNFALWLGFLKILQRENWLASWSRAIHRSQIGLSFEPYSPGWENSYIDEILLVFWADAHVSKFNPSFISISIAAMIERQESEHKLTTANQARS